MELRRVGRRDCIVFLFVSLASIFTSQCGARSLEKLKKTTKMDIFETLDPPTADAMDFLPPYGLPETPDTPFCVYPPLTPIIYGQSPPPPFYFTPIFPNPSPNPPESAPSPPETAPNPVPSPPEYIPNPPPESVPNPPGYIPSPPETVPNPPGYIPNPPETVPNPPGLVPNPPVIVPNPPGLVPNPPVIVPNPPGLIPNPPTYVPTPTIYFPPSPPEFVPGPPIFQPPVVFPPPSVPPPPYSGRAPFGVWCVAKPTVPDPIIQEAMNYACGSGADCNSIQPTGSCFSPDTLISHASYAFNSYWQRTKVVGGTCDFGGTAMLITLDPSYDGCHY